MGALLNPTVTVSRDVWDWVVVASTLVAVVIAAVAIVFAIKADRTVVRERQLTFELGVLAQLANACTRYWQDGRSEVAALLQLLPNDLPGLRKYTAEDHNSGADVLELYYDEYTRAVRRRMDI